MSTIRFAKFRLVSSVFDTNWVVARCGDGWAFRWAYDEGGTQDHIMRLLTEATEDAVTTDPVTIDGLHTDLLTASTYIVGDNESEAQELRNTFCARIAELLAWSPCDCDAVKSGHPNCHSSWCSTQ